MNLPTNHRGTKPSDGVHDNMLRKTRPGCVKEQPARQQNAKGQAAVKNRETASLMSERAQTLFIVLFLRRESKRDAPLREARRCRRGRGAAFMAREHVRYAVVVNVNQSAGGET